MNIKFDHCVIHVSNWDRANKFYAQVLGAEVVPNGNGFSYRFGNVQLNCHGPTVSTEPLAKIPVLPGGSDLSFVWPDSLEELLRHLQNHFVEIEMGPVRRFGAKGFGTSVYFRDPDGSLLEFIKYDKSTEHGQ